MILSFYLYYVFWLICCLHLIYIPPLSIYVKKFSIILYFVCFFEIFLYNNTFLLSEHIIPHKNAFLFNLNTKRETFLPLLILICRLKVSGTGRFPVKLIQRFHNILEEIRVKEILHILLDFCIHKH